MILLLLLSAEPASTQNLREFTVTMDNDGFVFWVPPDSRGDRYFTHGMRFEALVEGALPWAGLLVRGEEPACGKDPAMESCVLSRLTLGQDIYTPNYLFDADPASHDRPYAGWLYIEAMAERVSADRSTRLGLELGVTGKPSFAGQVHRWVHRALDKHEPLGWEHQLAFEPAFQIRYEARRAFPIGPGGRTASLDVEPNSSFTLGTLRTGVSFGISLLARWNAPAVLEWMEPGHEGPYIWLGTGVEAEFVARNLFLDGNIWNRDSPAEREVWVGRLQGRLRIGWQKVSLEFGATRSTLEFRGQEGSHTYGTIRLIIHPRRFSD